MKKHLNEQAITSELRGGSVFFRPSGSHAAEAAPSHQPPGQTAARPAQRQEPANDRTGEPPGRPIAPTPVRRIINRHAFEFYQDQVETLRRMALEGQLAGEKITMSEMVREALDIYIDKKRAEQ